MTLRLGAVTINTIDPEPLAAWWAERTAAEIVATNDGWYVVVRGGGLTHDLAFQRVEDPTPGKNKLHLDLVTDGDLDGAARELVAAGAALVADRSMGDFRWLTLADPDGNEFCVTTG